MSPEGAPVTRILIADDHEVVRSGLRAILESHEGWAVVAEAGDGKEAIAKAVETIPDVAIIDYSLPMMNGVEATRQIRARVPGAEVLIFTMHDSEVLVGELLEAGARAYLLKTDAKQHLIAAVESLANHKPFFTGKVSEQLLATFLGILAVAALIGVLVVILAWILGITGVVRGAGEGIRLAVRPIRKGSPG